MIDESGKSKQKYNTQNVLTSFHDQSVLLAEYFQAPIKMEVVRLL